MAAAFSAFFTTAFDRNAGLLLMARHYRGGSDRKSKLIESPKVSRTKTKGQR